MKIIVKYLSSDHYNHPLFISTCEIHENTFEQLSRLSSKLKNDFENSYINVYQNNDVIYVKTSSYHNELWPQGLYEIECVPIIKTNNQNQKYVVIKLLDLKRIYENCDIIYDF